MTCSNYCRQGRQKYPTPWNCGRAEREFPIHFVGEEPEGKNESELDEAGDLWKTIVFAAICLIALVAALSQALI